MLTKISKSLEYLSELEHIREALETIIIADRLLGKYTYSNAHSQVAQTKSVHVYCYPCMHVTILICLLTVADAEGNKSAPVSTTSMPTSTIEATTDHRPTNYF